MPFNGVKLAMKIIRNKARHLPTALLLRVPKISSPEIAYHLYQLYSTDNGSLTSCGDGWHGWRMKDDKSHCYTAEETPGPITITCLQIFRDMRGCTTSGEGVAATHGHCSRESKASGYVLATS